MGYPVFDHIFNRNLLEDISSGKYGGLPFTREFVSQMENQQDEYGMRGMIKAIDSFGDFCKENSDKTRCVPIKMIKSILTDARKRVQFGDGALALRSLYLAEKIMSAEPEILIRLSEIKGPDVNGYLGTQVISTLPDMNFFAYKLNKYKIGGTEIRIRKTPPASGTPEGTS